MAQDVAPDGTTLQAPLSATNLTLGANLTQVYTLPGRNGSVVLHFTTATVASIVFGYNNTFSANEFVVDAGVWRFLYTSNSNQIRIRTGGGGAVVASIYANQVALA